MTTDFKSNESVESLLPSDDMDDFSQFSMPSSGISALLPIYVRDSCRIPTSVDMRVSYDTPTNQSTYTYTLTWEEETNSVKKKTQVSEKRIKEVVVIPSPSASSSMSHLSERTFRGVAPVRMICDGPCHKEFPSSQLNTIGRCEHYLCVACYGIVKNSDGTVGCSSAHCNWKGKDRKQAKRHFEKEICVKQRIRAREMKSRDIDVKSASSASSRSNSRKSSPTTNRCSETDCSVSSQSSTFSSSSSSSFKPTYPSKNELIGIKIFILEPETASSGYTKSVIESEYKSSEKLKEVITSLVIQKFGSLPPRRKRGVLYHVKLHEDYTTRMHRVRSAEYDSDSVHEYSQINCSGDYILFVLDFDGFVKNGQLFKELK